MLTIARSTETDGNIVLINVANLTFLPDGIRDSITVRIHHKERMNARPSYRGNPSNRFLNIFGLDLRDQTASVNRTGAREAKLKH